MPVNKQHNVKKKDVYLGELSLLLDVSWALRAEDNLGIRNARLENPGRFCKEQLVNEV